MCVTRIGGARAWRRQVHRVGRESVALLCDRLRRQCVAACVPGNTLRQIHQLSVRLLCDGLAQLRVFPGLTKDTLASGAYQAVYPHSVGAPHDTLLLRAWGV